MRPASKRKRSGRKKGRGGGLKWRYGEHRRGEVRERGGTGRSSSCSCPQRAYNLAEEYWTI